MSTIDQTKVRADLDTERAELQHQLDELEMDGRSAPDVDENFADSAQVAAGHVENLTLAAQFREQINEIDAAFARLDDGTYGRCEVCGEYIGDARLEAMPAARFCISHA